MNILDLCDNETAVVALDATVAEAIQMMLTCQVGGVAVIDEFRHVCGIFTERDVLVKLALSGLNPSETPVRALMTKPVMTAPPSVGASEGLVMMMEGHFRHLPIVDPAGRIAGLLSMRNLLQWRADDLNRELDALEQYYGNDSLGG